MIFLPYPFDKKKTYYTSGPMSDYPDHNFPYFTEVALHLREAGLQIVSPHEIPINHPAPWVECLKADLAELLKCDGIIMLKGWPQSQGARLELDIAQRLEYPTYYLNEYQLIDLNKEGLFL